MFTPAYSFEQSQALQKGMIGTIVIICCATIVGVVVVSILIRKFHKQVFLIDFFSSLFQASELKTQLGLLNNTKNTNIMSTPADVVLKKLVGFKKHPGFFSFSFI